MGETAAVPAAPDDRRVLLFAGGLVLLAGVAVAALLFLATGGTRDTPSGRNPLFLGLEPELNAKIKEGGPLYFASHFGENGFWLDLENGQIVALDIVKPGTKDCQVKWRDPRSAYVDCNDQDLQAADLDRYQVTVGGLQKDAPRESVYVSLKIKEPAPIAAGSE